MGLPDDTVDDDINHIQLLKTILVLNVAILIGFSLHEALVHAGLKLPLFVACLLAAIALTNTVPRLFPQIRWPSRTRGLALVSDLSLNVFLSISLISMHFGHSEALGRLWSRCLQFKPSLPCSTWCSSFFQQWERHTTLPSSRPGSAVSVSAQRRPLLPI